jgi:hypothetical protein
LGRRKENNEIFLVSKIPLTMSKYYLGFALLSVVGKIEAL